VNGPRSPARPQPAAREEILVLIAASALLTAVAWRVHPAWDDGWLLIQLQEGAGSLRASMADRPLLGLAWSRLAEAGVLLPVSAALHGAAWLGLALVTRALWRRLFPARAAFGLTVALLVTSTVVLEIQHVLVNPVGGSVVGAVLVYLALLLLWPDDGEAVPGGRGARTLAAAAALLAAGLLSEYGLVSAVAAATLLAVRGLGAPGPSRRRHWRSAALLLATAMAGYLLFALIADPAARPNIRPAHILALPAARWMAMPFVGLTRIWQGSLGGLLGDAGAAGVDSAETLLAAAGGLLAASIVFLLLRRGSAVGAESAPASPRPAAAARTVPASWSAAALFAASTVGVLAIVALGRVPGPGVASRYYLPSAPALACLGLWSLLWLLRPALHRPAAAAVAFVAVFATAVDAASLIAERERIERLALAVGPSLAADRFNLVVLLDARGRPPRQATGYELTARFTAALGPELGGRLWVVRSEDREREGVRGVELFGASPGPPELHLALRGLGGRYAVERVVWVEPDGPAGPRVTVEDVVRDASATAGPEVEGGEPRQHPVELDAPGPVLQDVGPRGSPPALP